MSVYVCRMKDHIKTDRVEVENLPNYLRELGTEVRFISLVTETEVEMRKTGNPFVGTIKVVRRNGLVNVNHSERPKRRMMEQGIENPVYIPGPTWYLHETTSEGKILPLCFSKKDNTQKYLQYFPHRSYETKYVLDGVPLTEIEISIMKTFIPKKDWGSFKEPVITLKMVSIKSIKFRKINLSVLG